MHHHHLVAHRQAAAAQLAASLLPAARAQQGLDLSAGPVDYTQGAMRNASRKNFRAVNNHPMSQGTRAHQAALYVVFESPLQMLCDSPSHYLREAEFYPYSELLMLTYGPRETVAVNIYGNFDLKQVSRLSTIRPRKR